MPQRNGFHAAPAARPAAPPAAPPAPKVPPHVLLAGAFVKALIRVCGKLLLRDMDAAATEAVTPAQEGALAEALDASGGGVPTEDQFGALFGALGAAGLLADGKVAVLNDVAAQFAERNRGTTVFGASCDLDWAVKRRLDTLAPSELFLTRAFLRLMKRKIAAASAQEQEKQAPAPARRRKGRHRAVGRRRREKKKG